MNIRDYVEGDNIDAVFILDSFNKRQTSNGKAYYNMKLRRMNDILNAVDWDTVSNAELTDVGKLVRVKGIINFYQGVRQLTVKELDIILKEDVPDINDIIPCAPIDVNDYITRLNILLSHIVDEDYKSLTEHVISHYFDLYKVYPAAKSHHHYFINGLLMHSCNVAEICFLISKVYSKFVNTSLLVAGAILHDIGKIEEYTRSELGLVNGKSLAGELKGHSCIGSEILLKYGSKLNIPKDKLDLIQHMLLSHHGKLEYNAAMVPLILEAEILSMADNLDFRAEVYRENLVSTKIGSFSSNVYSLGHPIYNHSYSSI